MADRNKEPPSPIKEEKAMEHALFAVRSNWVNEVYGFEGWGGAELGKKPLEIYDLNGQLLFYEYDVTQGDMPVGSIKTSASKIIGSAVPQIQLVARRWDADNALAKAKEEVLKRYPNAKITGTELVCYSYPKIGVKVDMDDPGSGAGSMIFDVSDLSVVDMFG
jgi:hypothetical protein